MSWEINLAFDSLHIPRCNLNPPPSPRVLSTFVRFQYIYEVSFPKIERTLGDCSTQWRWSEQRGEWSAGDWQQFQHFFSPIIDSKIHNRRDIWKLFFASLFIRFSCVTAVLASFLFRFSCVTAMLASFVFRFSCVTAVLASFLFRFSCVIAVLASFFGFTCVTAVLASFLFRFSCVTAVLASFLFRFSCVTAMLASGIPFFFRFRCVTLVLASFLFSSNCLHQRCSRSRRM